MSRVQSAISHDYTFDNMGNKIKMIPVDKFPNLAKEGVKFSEYIPPLDNQSDKNEKKKN
jgi:hypothetical protein